MLLKYSQAEKRTKASANSKQQRATGAMKLTVGLPTPRVNRKVMKGLATKRTAVGQQRLISARTEERTTVDPCDNSNDSGLGFDHHLEFQLAARSTVRFADQEASWANEHSEVKRKKLEIKLESDDANDNFSFPETMSRRDKRGDETERLTPRSGEVLPQVGTTPTVVARTQARPQAVANRRSASLPIASQLTGMSRDGKSHLQIICQPEQQHRARYQTEGSRGAVKDRSGNGFPVVKLVGYNKPATLQVFIGTDVGRVAPHMFYQACRVSGKNSTPCVERKIDGTIVIEVDFDPAKDMVITCDCVGILKERNVDVEHRFPEQSGSRNKKKSTRCRMVFRTTITHPDGTTEILQTTSQPIVCTQPPGVPEICKKSLSTCQCTGGMELFILGKNFLKDTRVVFQHGDAPSEATWEDSVQPDKEFLQQTHLVCMVPPYRRIDLTEPVNVRLVVVSSGKTSEPHNFTYTPTLQQPAVAPEGTQPCVTLVESGVSHAGAEVPHVFARSTVMLSDAGSNPVAVGTAKSSPKKSQYIAIEPAPLGEAEVHPVMMWQSSSLVPTSDSPKLDNKALEPKQLDRVLSGKMMPPPLLPIAARRASSNLRMIVPDTDPTTLLPEKLKTELTEDGSSQSPEDVKGIDLRMKPVATVADLLSTQSPTMATFRQFVTGSTNVPLPTQSAQSVEKYLSHLEHATGIAVVSKGAADHLVASCKTADTVASTVTQTGLSRQSGSSSQFDSASTLFGQQQQPTTTANSIDQKLQFASDLPMPLMYGTQTGATLTEQECKSQFAAEETSLLQQATVARRKSMFDDTLAIGPNADPGLGDRRPMVIMQESQTTENQIPSNNSCSTLVESLDQNVSMLTNTPALLQTSSGLIYGSPERAATNTLLPTSAQQREGDVMNSLSKGSDSVIVSGIGGSVRDSILLSAPPLQTSSSVLNDQMLAVTQSSIIATAQNARLDALVSSAINTHVLGTGNHVQSSDADKLDALVNSAAVSHMMSATSCPPITVADNVMLNTPIQAPLRQQDVPVTCRTSPVPVKKMSLTSPVSSNTGLGGFDLMSTQHAGSQISRENAHLLNSAVSAALSEHLLAAPTQTQVQTAALANAQLSIDTSASSSPVNTLYSSHDRTSPIALKNMLLNSSVATAVEGQILVASPTRTSPVAVKSMVLGSPDTLSHNQILASSSTSPIAVKKLVAMPTAGSPDNQMLVVSPTTPSLAPMKNILNSTMAQQGDSQMIATSPTRTSPIAMKAMILESASVNTESCLTNSPHTSPIAVKTMLLNSQLSDTVNASIMPGTTVQSTHLSADNVRLDALVQSTLSNHALVPNPTQVTSAMEVHAGDGLTLLSPQTHMQESSQVSSTSPLISQSPVCITALVTQPSEPSTHLSVPTVTTGEVLLNTMFATSRSSTNSNSSAHAHNFNKELSVTVGTDSQVPHCTGGLSQGSALLHTSQFTTASSSSQSLLTGITMPSKVAEPSTHLSVPTVTTGEVLLNTIFATSRSPTNSNSSAHAHNFNKELSVTLGTDSQVPHCTGGLSQGSALLHTSQFTTASSSSQSLLTGVTMPSKVAEELAAQSRDSSSGFVTQMLLDLAADEKMKKDSQITLISRDKMTESMQRRTDFVSVAENKLPETRLFPSAEMLKAAVGVATSAHVEPSVLSQNAGTTMSNLVVAKTPQTQEVQEQQCKLQQRHTVVPQTTSCVTGTTSAGPGQPQKKAEEGMVPQELTQMSENDLLSYINPSTFDQV